MSRWKQALDSALTASFVVAFFVVVIAIGLIQPYMEARAYERVTGKHVSVWDAVWLDLRVQASPEESR